MTSIECDTYDNDIITKVANIYIEEHENKGADNLRKVTGHMATLARSFKYYMIKTRGFPSLRKGQLMGFLCITCGFNTYLKLIVGGGKTTTSIVSCYASNNKCEILVIVPLTNLFNIFIKEKRKFQFLLVTFYFHHWHFSNCCFFLTLLDLHATYLFLFFFSFPAC